MLPEIRAIVQNVAMGVKPVRDFASRFHSTGMNGSDAAIREMYGLYRSHVDVRDRVIVELGPGQTPNVLYAAARDGARQCIGFDIQEYDAPSAGSDPRVSVRIYDGRVLPIDDASVDIVWSSDVLEHLRYPEISMREVSRVLVPGGTAIFRVDLRDHYRLDREEQWLHCLRYSEPLWRAMTWNRSSFVNRLRYSEWRGLFARVGLEEVNASPLRSEVLRRLHERGRLDLGRRASLPVEDLEVYRFDVVLRKPARRGRAYGSA